MPQKRALWQGGGDELGKGQFAEDGRGGHGRFPGVIMGFSKLSCCSSDFSKHQPDGQFRLTLDTNFMMH